MEENDFMLVVAQMAQGVEECFLLTVINEGVGEDDYKGAPVKLFGEEVEGIH